MPGLDVAGTAVAAIGSAVTRFAVGDEVFGVSRGSFAEYAAAREDKLTHKPANISFEQAAVVGISGGTALQALTAGRLQAGQQVLIIGASGSVGSYGVQLAKAAGVEVTGVAGTGKVDLVTGDVRRFESGELPKTAPGAKCQWGQFDPADPARTVAVVRVERRALGLPC